MTIKEAIQALAGALPVQVVVGTIKSVDESAMTCNVEIQGSPEVFDVRLRAVIDKDDSGVLVVPEVGSYVLVGRIDNRIESSFIVGFSRVAKVRLVTPSIELVGTAHGGIVKVQELVDKLNALEDAVNNLATAFDSHTHASPPAPANPVTTAPPSAPSNISINNTQVADLENENVQHG